MSNRLLVAIPSYQLFFPNVFKELFPWVRQELKDITVGEKCDRTFKIKDPY